MEIADQAVLAGIADQVAHVGTAELTVLVGNADYFVPAETAGHNGAAGLVGNSAGIPEDQRLLVDPLADRGRGL